MTGLSEATLEPAPAVAPTPPPRTLSWRFRGWQLLPILLVAGAAMIGGMRHVSTTFDEILMPTAGARGYATGHFNLVNDHPRFAQYLYGLPVYLSHPHYPPEKTKWGYWTRYSYARAFYWEVGNDPERIAFIARLAGVAMALLLACAVYLYGRRFGRGVGLLAAGLVAFLPDVLGHGSITYNDVPMALGYLLGIWALDAAVRRPTFPRILLAGATCAFALSVKFSAIALGPVGVLLAAAEAVNRPRDWAWWRRILLGTPVLLLVVYIGTVISYGGDFALSDFSWGLRFNIIHAEKGHGPLPTYLLGHRFHGDVWYFFPIALLLKTPAALHVLAVLGIAGFAARAGRLKAAGSLDGDVASAAPDAPAVPDAARASRAAAAWRMVRRVLAHPARGLLLGALVFLGFLMSSRLTIGVRHALPVLPPVCLLIAIGVGHFWRQAALRGRLAVVALALACAASSLWYYPQFLTYTSEYGPPKDEGYKAFVDSSLDWGQGLLELRDYMREHNIPVVYLSYFGSAEPAGYGIHYVPMLSYMRLMPQPKPAQPPRYVAVSATILAGDYLRSDPWRWLREDVRPVAVLGNTIYLYAVDENAGPGR